jgi:hypothetical protein
MCSANESISYIDFSIDGLFLKIQSKDFELFYYNVETGRRDRKEQAFCDVKWDNPTCTMAWELQGIWQ